MRIEETEMHPLRAERLHKGWTQRQLADFSLVSLSTVERAERGEPISLDSRQRLSECLNKTYEQLGLLVSEADLNGNATKQEALPPTRFLTMQPEELLKRYAGEKEHLLKLKTQEIAWTLPQVVVIDNSQLRIAMSAIHVQVDELHPEYIIPKK
jgi:transcriptional regulator with XRE-family HTH domain